MDCSDQVPPAEIQRAVERHAGDPDAAVRELIDAANRAGGKDNVTVVMVEGERSPRPPRRSKPNRGAEERSPIASVFVYLALAWRAGFAAISSHQSRRSSSSRARSPPAPARVPTIAAALAAARNGDTVEVLAGEYREHVFLKSGVTLRSRVAARSAPDRARRATTRR